MTCDERCWTPLPCPVCGEPLPPRGRSVAPMVNLSSCCYEHRYDEANQRHLWSQDEAADWPGNKGGAS